MAKESPETSGVSARRSIGMALGLIGGLLAGFFVLQAVLAIQDHARAREIQVTDRIAKNIVQSITDLGVVRGFTMTYLARPAATDGADVAELERRYRSGRALLDEVAGDLASFRPELRVRIAATIERATSAWERARRELALARDARDVAFSQGWFAAYSAIIGELEALLVESRSPDRLNDPRFAFLSDLRIAILRWRLLRTREMGTVGATVAAGTPGSAAMVADIDMLRARADTLFAQIGLLVGSVTRPALDLALRRVEDALVPLNQAYERTRTAWRDGQLAPIAPPEHDRLTLAAIDSINRLIAAISDEAQRYAGDLNDQAALRLAGSFALFLAGLALAALSWRMVAGAVIVPLEGLAATAQSIAGGARDARAAGGGAAEIRAAAAQFNRMLDAVDLAQRDLERSNADLERGRQEIAARERQLHAVTENLPVFIAYLDRERRLRFVNRTAAQWLARPAGALLGMAADLAMPEGPWPAAADRPAATAPRQTAALFPDGQQRDVECILVPDNESGGALAGHFVLAIDISERKRAEAQLAHAQRIDSLGKLTGGVAHDFNNLLAVIAGNLELLAERLGDQPDSQDLARAAIRATERGATLTRSLLAFARQQALDPVALDLNELVGDMADLLRRTLPESIAIKLAPAQGLWPCEADPGQLQNTLLNLVVNARDAMPDGGSLTIETGNVTLGADYAAAHAEVTPGEYVMLAVSDTGTGMTRDVAARAFEPFFTTKELSAGTGLGLSMVYGFAKQSGGHVSIYSEVGVGTTIKIYLPRSHAVIERNAAAASPAPAADGETILLVEDDADVLALVFALLRSLGYTVERATTGATALRRLDEHPDIALLLTDVILPGGMNGPQLAERALARRPNLRVVYMSGYTENAMLQNDRLKGGTKLLHKPFTKERLAAALREALDAVPKSDAAKASALIVDDEPAFAELVRNVASALGFEARTAASGSEFQARYAERVPDVVVMDIVMPGIDGIELIRWLSSQKFRGKLVAVTGYNPQYLRAAQAFGALSGNMDVSVLTKPVKLAELRQIMSDALPAEQ